MNCYKKYYVNEFFNIFLLMVIADLDFKKKDFKLWLTVDQATIALTQV